MIKSIKKRKKYKVVWKGRLEKRIIKCPQYIQQKFGVLVEDLKNKGPIQKGWSNFSELKKDVYHCHLDYHWVAVWHCEKDSIVVEVTYVGSREKAPY